MSPPLTGLRVWITRPAAAAARSVTAWEATGATVWSEPLLDLVDAEPAAAQATAWSQLDEPFGVVLTSAYAAGAFRRWSGDRALKGPAYVVGESTAEEAARLGFDVRHVASRATGAALAAELREQPELPPVLVYPASELRRPQTQAALTQLPVRVLELFLYRPVPRRPSPQARAFLETPPAVATIYSPSAAHALADAFPTASCVAMGPTSRSEATARGLAVVACATDPGEDSLVRATIEWWESRP